MTLWCDVCGKELSPASEPVRIYPSRFCGVKAYCFEHDKGTPDFGSYKCKVCGNENLSLLRISRNKQERFCMKCGQSRSGRNLIHIPGKDCNHE